MSGNAWFLHRAEECARLANANPLTRTQYEEEARMWRQIADDIAKDERDQFGSDAA